jgi:hypothetical protein
MSVEKAFAIQAAPDVIFAAIERDLAAAGEHAGDTFEVIRRDPPHSIEMRVTIGNIPCWLTYALEPRDGYTEIVGRMTPFGWKNAVFRLMTFGMRDQGYEVALVEALANLKAEVEDPDGDEFRRDDDAGNELTILETDR